MVRRRLLGWTAFDRAEVRRLQLVASEVEGDEVFLHYRNLRAARP